MAILHVIEQIVDSSLPFIDQVPFLRAVLGFILVFFLPGFAWTLIFFRRAVLIERVVLSFGLSIALVTLTVCVTNLLFDVRITGLNVFLTIIAITAIPAVPYCVMRFAVNREKS